MVRKGLLLTACAVFFTAVSLFGAEGWAKTEKPTIIKPCKQCHKPEKNRLRGKLGNVSMKAETIQVQIGPVTWLVDFDEDTKLVGAEKFNKIKKGKEIAVEFKKRGEALYARSVYVKPPARIPEEKLIKVDKLASLVTKGPEKGKFLLVDARPGKRYHEGHIPGAISVYDAQFDKNIDKLPKDKNTLIIYYCGGPS